MKTPMQELIEIIKKRQEDDEAMPFMYNDRIIKLAESMLEKEKEVIIQTSVNAYTAGYLDNQAKVDDSMNFPEEYYNETFNTKER